MAREEDQQPDIEEVVQLPGSETMTVSEDDKDAEEPEEQEPKAAPARDKAGKWTAKKSERRNIIRENDEFRQTTKTMAEQIKAMEERSSRQMADLIAALRPQQQAPAASPEVGRIDQEIQNVTKLMKAELQAIANGGAEDEYYKLQDRRMELIADKRAAAQGWGKQQPQQQAGISPEHAARGALIGQEFPGFESHEKWSIVAGRLRQTYLAAGHPDTLATDRLVVQEAARLLGIATRAAPPSQRTRQAYGAPAGAGRQQAAPRTMQIPRNLIAGSGLTEKQVAEALWDDE